MLVMILALAACSRGPSPGAPPPVPGGAVVGRLVSQKADGSDRTPIAGQAIGVFTQPVIPGKVLQHPPTPIATTMTSPDGSFTFHRLSPGRYFITVDETGSSVAGHWVVVAPDRGASILLTHCTNCPGPL